MNSEGYKPLEIRPIDPRNVLPEDGTLNYDTDPTKYNGVGAFRMLPSTDFNTDPILQNIKAPKLGSAIYDYLPDPTFDIAAGVIGVGTNSAP